MLANEESISFLATCDPEVARRFYEEVLGLTFVSEDHFALVFELNERVLRIATVDEFMAAKHTVLGWQVKDIVETAAALIRKGVVFEQFDGMDQDKNGIWLSPSGARVAWFKDPDNNVLSLTELAEKDRGEV